MIRIDMHAHTDRSGHATTTPEMYRKVQERTGMWFAITDHDTADAALSMEHGMDLVVGEEVMTDSGEVIGYFLTETVLPGTIGDVFDAIHAQGGLVCIPHPFDRLRGSRVKDTEWMRKADLIEVRNARTFHASDDARAEGFARENGIPMTAGSDAHTRREIGASYIEMEPFDSPSGFLRNLEGAGLHGGRTSPLIHGFTKALKLVR